MTATVVVVGSVVAVGGGNDLPLPEHAERTARPTSATRRCITFTVLAMVFAACAHGAARFDVSSVGAGRTTTTAVTVTSTTLRATTATAAPKPVTVTTAKPRAVPQLAGITGNQAIVVTAAHYGDTKATWTAYQRSAKGWTVALGPWTANVGKKGIAPAGEKREGDLRTPTGTFGFDFMFGVQPDPGVKFPFRRVSGPNIVWVENPDSPLYNEWVDSNQHPEEADEDNMYKPTVYAYGAVINYNTAARTPGLGSGIFMHVQGAGPTAGCVSLPESKLVTALKWLDPAASPAIVIGVG